MHSKRIILLGLVFLLCFVPILFAADGVQAANSSSQGCKQFVVHEMLQDGVYAADATMGGQSSDFINIGVAAAPAVIKAVGNVIQGKEALLFNFPDGTFVLTAKYEVIGDLTVLADVHGAGEISNGTGAYAGATGHLNYQGPFAVDQNGFIYLDLYYRGQVCLK